MQTIMIGICIEGSGIRDPSVFQVTDIATCAAIINIGLATTPADQSCPKKSLPSPSRRKDINPRKNTKNDTREHVMSGEISFHEAKRFSKEGKQKTALVDIDDKAKRIEEL
jgi:hypothetical protein